MYMLPRMSDDIRLMCQNLANGMRSKPCVDLDEPSPSGGWAVRSVDVRTAVSGVSHIAATFCPNALKGVRSESFYKTFLREIENSDSMKSTDIWYNEVLVDRAEGPETSIFHDRITNSSSSEGRGATVKFRDDQTLITPGGVFDILSAEKLSSDSIFRPLSELQNRNDSVQPDTGSKGPTRQQTGNVRRFVSDADSDYRSRVLCVVPDALQDQTMTDITVVWPSSEGSQIMILLLPQGESTMPVLITSGIASRSLLDDVYFEMTGESGDGRTNT